jgi:hypothetical protein
MMMIRAQADAIAVLVHQLRPDWDIRGVMAALADCQDRDAATVAIAAVRAATTASNRTPAVIAMEGPHWGDGPAEHTTERRTSRPEQLPLNALCDRHKRDPRTCPWCTGKMREHEEEPA